MSPTHDYILSNQSGASFRTDLNNALAAIVSNNSNSSSPSTTAAYMWWADTTTGTLKIRNSENNAWIELLQLDGTLTLEDGSVGSPALAFRDDLDTGIFSSGNNIFDIATGGVARLQLDSSETTFNEDGSDTDFRIESDAQTHMFFLDAGNSRIGINKSNPSHTFHIVPVATSTDANDSVTGSTLAINSIFVRNKGNSVGISGQAYSNQIICSNGSNVALEIYTQGSATGCPIVFGVNASEKMRLAANGHLAINTTTASTLLHVRNTSSTGYDANDTTNNSAITIENNQAQSHATLQFQSVSGGTANTGQATINVFNETDSSKNTAMAFCTRQDSNSANKEHYRITGIGNLNWNQSKVRQRKTSFSVSQSGNTQLDIALTNNFEANDIVRVQWAFNWNAGDGGAWGSAVVWKMYEGTVQQRLLGEEVASPAEVVVFIESSNTLSLRFDLVQASGMNGFAYISAECVGCDPTTF